MLRQFIAVIIAFACFSVDSTGQSATSTTEKKPYFIRITMDKLKLGNDSVTFKAPKTLYVESNAKSDTIGVGSVKGIPVAMVVEIQKYMSGPNVRYRFNYTFLEKEHSKWTVIKTFGWVDRFSLLPKPDEVKKPGSKKPAQEKFFCSIGEPMQFSASFRMDIYLNQ